MMPGIRLVSDATRVATSGTKEGNGWRDKKLTSTTGGGMYNFRLTLRDNLASTRRDSISTRDVLSRARMLR